MRGRFSSRGRKLAAIRRRNRQAAARRDPLLRAYRDKVEAWLLKTMHDALASIVVLPAEPPQDLASEVAARMGAGNVPYTEGGIYLLACEMARGQGYDPADVVRESCRFEGGVLHFTVVPKIRQVTLTATVEI